VEMKGRITVLTLCAMLLALCASAEAQQPTKVQQIGYLSTPPLSVNADRIDAFRQGLRELGYVEGKNIIIEWRSAEGKEDRLPTLATELVRLKTDVIVTAGAISTRAAKAATSTIPIVMAQDPDPVGNGFVASLAQPGGKITGLSRLAPEISGKQLELLKETVPRLSRVGVLGNAALPGQAQILKEVQLAAAALRVKLHLLDVRSPQDIETSFRGAGKTSADAVLVLETPLINSQRLQIAALAVKSRLPAIYMNPEYVEDGGLMSYGASINDLYRRAATYVDKILKGAKPADLPVEQPKKFEFIINLKAAKQIGLTIPPNVLVRADKVIK
jgi:putative tryptophan/tyrosine transport system substrate-binding protein